jgi:hypothetical protein
LCVCVCWRAGRRWRSWLTQCATSHEVAGSIPDGVITILHWLILPDRTMALGSTQALAEISTRGKGGLCVGLTILPLSRADCREIV